MDGDVMMNMIAAAAATAASGMAYVAARRAYRASVSLEGGDALSTGRRLLAPLANQVRPTNPDELEALTTQLMNAGRRHRDDVDRYGEERVFALLAGMAIAMLATAVFDGLFAVLLGLIAALVGITGPRKRMERRANQRREAIATSLPSAVDLLTTCVEAGLSLERAVARVGRELALTSPTLAEELTTTASEFEAGVALPNALRRLARRVGLDDLSALCGVIAQAHGLGSPIGDTLREYAHSSRQRRMSMLEERAGKVAAQLTIPLALCLLPAAMMIILGPAVMQLVRALS